MSCRSACRVYLFPSLTWLSISFKDLALRTAENERADYILAQDPDSDRFTAAERGYNLID
jgi:phosphomannomutase